MPKVIDLSAPPEVGLSAFQSGAALPMAAGLYYTAPSAARSTAALVNNVVRAKRITIARTCVITSLAMEVTVAGASNAIIRLGLYPWNLGVGQSLLVDAGTIAAATTGVKTLAVNIPVNIGDNLLLTSTLQNNPNPVPSVRCYSGDDDPQLGGSALAITSSVPKCLLATSTVFGNFPTDLVWGAEDGSAPLIAVMAAA